MENKLGVGKFRNVYGISGNNVTAGQKDYAARMMQIEKQREEYYKSLGTPPGVPTMKGATADPDNTGRGYNEIIGDLGDHSVPEGWVQRPKFNDKGDAPGPPIQWQKPEDPDNAQPGYGYVPTDTTNTEDIFFYHSDHLGSTSYITDAKANITQFDAYLPYGELLVDEHSSSEEMPYKFNGKELDEETGLYYYGARYMDPKISMWLGVDALTENYPNRSCYVYTSANPINRIDPDGNIEWPLRGNSAVNKKDAPNSGFGLKNTVVRTSLFREYRKVGTSPHIGIDYRASIGTPVYSLGDGTVKAIETTKSGIKYVTIEYSNGDQVRFLHLSSFNPELKVNDVIYEGQQIGLSGNSGRYKGKDGLYHNYPPHLHVDAIDKNGKKISPEANNYGKVTNEEFFNTYNGDYMKLRNANILPEVVITAPRKEPSQSNPDTTSNEKTK